MTRNVTLRMDEELLRKLRHRAVDQHRSLSSWVVTVLAATVETEEAREAARNRALKRLQKGFHLGGRPLPREDAHAR